MHDVIIYHNPDCGTSRNTLGLIRNAGIEPHVIEYLKSPPSRAMLKSLIARMGIAVRDLIRVKGTPYNDLGLDDPALTDDQFLDAMMAHPILINRPIVMTLPASSCAGLQSSARIASATPARRVPEGGRRIRGRKRRQSCFINSPIAARRGRRTWMKRSRKSIQRVVYLHRQFGALDHGRSRSQPRRAGTISRLLGGQSPQGTCASLRLRSLEAAALRRERRSLEELDRIHRVRTRRSSILRSRFATMPRPKPVRSGPASR